MAAPLGIISSRKNENHDEMLIKVKNMRYQKRRTVYLVFGLLVIIATLVLVFIPYFDEYQTKISKNEDLLHEIEGDIAFRKIGLKDEQKQLLHEVSIKKEEVTKTNKELIDKLQKLMPHKYNKTDLVRMFESFVYSYNSPSSPFHLIAMNFTNPTASEDGNFRIAKISMNLKSSKENFERLMYLIDTSGSLKVSEIIDQEKLDALKGILEQKEFNELNILIENENFDRDDVKIFLRDFSNDKIKQSLLTNFFKKPLFFLEYKKRIEDRYYPAQLMSIESFNLRVNDNPAKSQNEMDYTLEINCYFQ